MCYYYFLSMKIQNKVDEEEENNNNNSKQQTAATTPSQNALDSAG